MCHTVPKCSSPSDRYGKNTAERRKVQGVKNRSELLAGGRGVLLVAHHTAAGPDPKVEQNARMQRSPRVSALTCVSSADTRERRCGSRLRLYATPYVPSQVLLFWMRVGERDKIKYKIKKDRK